jgi:hypothetical protein
LLFEIDPEPLSETLTALGGIPLVVRAFRSLGLPDSVRQPVQIKERKRGYDEPTFVPQNRRSPIETARLVVVKTSLFAFDHAVHRDFR